MLFLIPTFLSENEHVLSEEVLEIARSLDEFVVENEKSARKFLKQIGTRIHQNNIVFHLLNEHTSDLEISNLLPVLKKNKNIGLLSEAGCPAVADPGAVLVRMAHENNIAVKPLTGPSSILLALMASGLNGQSFAFHGYLPRDIVQRKSKISLLEKDAQKKKQTQIFIETPYRNQPVLNDILNVCSENTLLCIACDLTSAAEFVKTKTIAAWKIKLPALDKKPTIFLLGA